MVNDVRAASMPVDGSLYIPFESPNRRGEFRPNVDPLVDVVYQEAAAKFPGMVSVPDFRPHPLTVKVPMAGMLLAPWGRGLQRTEVARLEPGADKELPRFLMNGLSERTGVRASFERAAAGVEDTAQVFDPATLKAADLLAGGVTFNTKANPASRPVLDGFIRVVDLLGYQKKGVLQLSGQLETLLSHYSQTDTLDHVVADLNRVTLRQDETSQGWQFGVTSLSEQGERGVPLTGQAAFQHLYDLHQAEMKLPLVDRDYLVVASSVYHGAQAAGGKLNLSQSTDREGQTHARFLVGTGLAGEIANSTALTAFQAGMGVYMPDLNMGSSKVAAALVVKKAMTAAKVSEKGDVVVYGGPIVVDQVNGLNPGEVHAKTKGVLQTFGARAIMAGMMYAGGGGREVLTEISQHAVAMRLAEDGLLEAKMSLVSPTRAGKIQNTDFEPEHIQGIVDWMKMVAQAVLTDETRTYRNDAAAFQGVSYNVAQLAKVWSAAILKDKDIPAISPTGFMSGTRGLLTDLVNQLLPHANRLDLFPAWDPATTGSFLGVLLVAMALEQDGKLTPSVIDSLNQANFDGAVAASPYEMSELLARVFALSKQPNNPAVAAGVGAHEPKVRFVNDHKAKTATVQVRPTVAQAVTGQVAHTVQQVGVRVQHAKVSLALHAALRIAQTQAFLAQPGRMMQAVLRR